MDLPVSVGRSPARERHPPTLAKARRCAGKASRNDGGLGPLSVIIVGKLTISQKPRAILSTFKPNPTTFRYILKNAEIVDRAIKQADIIFPISGLVPVSDENYYKFKYDAYPKLENILRSLNPRIDKGIIITIIVEAQSAVDKLVAVRATGYDAAITRFGAAEILIKKITSNLNSSIEILKEISQDSLLLDVVMGTMREFQKETDSYFADMAKRFEDVPLDILNAVPEAKQLMYILGLFVRMNMPLLRLKEDLANSKLIRSAAEYRCASTLAWIWWEHVRRHPTTTRNTMARARGAVPKTTFQSFVAEAIPLPPLSEGIMRKVYDDLRVITNIGITETRARDLLLKARSDAKLSERCGHDAQLLLALMRGILGERLRRKSGHGNPQA